MIKNSTPIVKKKFGSNTLRISHTRIYTYPLNVCEQFNIINSQNKIGQLKISSHQIEFFRRPIKRNASFRNYIMFVGCFFFAIQNKIDI